MNRFLHSVLSLMLCFSSYLPQSAGGGVVLGGKLVVGGGGAITFVQGNTATNTTLAISEGLNFTSAVTAGDLVVAYVETSNGFAGPLTVTVSDNVNSGNWTAIGSPANDNGQEGAEAQFFYFANTASASANSMTVTAALSTGTQKFVVIIMEFAGAATSSPLDTSASFVSTTNTSTSATAPSITTAGPNELVLTTCGTTHNNTNVNFAALAVNSPYTMPASTLHVSGGGGVAMRVATSPGSNVGGTFSWSFGNAYINWTVAFKP
jgi:hypothetical protein